MRHHRLAAAVLTVSVTATALFHSAPAQAASQLNGAGSSFMQNEMEQWIADTSKAPYNLKINYNPSGSGSGRQNFADGVIDFGGSDIQYQPEDKKPARPFVYVAISGGGLAFMFNLKQNGAQVQNLKLTSETVCKIFTGAITDWGDPLIQADNPGLRSGRITPVNRAESAGTSFVMAEYCIALQFDVWKTFIDKLNASAGAAGGFNSSSDTYPTDYRPLSVWPSFSGSQKSSGSNGVADTVASSNGDGKITGVETGFATVARNFPVAAVKNLAGTFAKPTTKNVTNALQKADLRPNGTHNLHFDLPGAEIYNPSLYSYFIAPTDVDTEKGKALGTFLNYALTKGQTEAEALGYAPLDPGLVGFSLDNVQKIPGAPPRPSGAPAAAAATATNSNDIGVGASAAASRSTTAARAAASSSASRAASAAGGTGLTAGGGAGVDPSVGPLGSTGADHVSPVLLGVLLMLLGETLRRRSVHRRRSA
jgi:ABC-type phosphate transport system substrate-binding protein